MQGKEGVHLRKSKFELIEDGFVQNSGLKQLSYQASGRTRITGGTIASRACSAGLQAWLIFCLSSTVCCVLHCSGRRQCGVGAVIYT